MSNLKTRHKKLVSEPVFLVKYIDNFNKEHSFKSTKSMLDSHKRLMGTNNQYIKSFSVQPITGKE